VSLPTETPDSFSEAETRVLAPYFTNTDRQVFALVNLPETVKGALFARYSRSAKSLRRLFLDEFAAVARGGARCLGARRSPLRAGTQRVRRRLGRATRQRSHCV
jgi:hypothetical protein